ALGTARHLAGRRRLGVETAVTGTVWRPENRSLPVEAEDAAVNVRLLLQHADIVDEIARRKIVGAVDDEVVRFTNRQRVRARQPGLEQIELHLGVNVWQALLGRLQLGAADVRGAVQHLALQVAEIDDVEIDQADAAAPRRGQVQTERRAETAGA